MKILRVVHGIANNVLDVTVPETFNLAIFIKEVKADACICVGDTWINYQWIQHMQVMTAEDASKALVQGMSKN